MKPSVRALTPVLFATFLIVGMPLAAWYVAQQAQRPGMTVEQMEKVLPKAVNPIRGDAWLVVDDLTGCHYLRANGGGITPRLTRDGTPMCGPQDPLVEVQ